MSEGQLQVTMEQIKGFEFKVAFDWPTAGEITLDEPEPLGERHGPNASRILAAAVGNCLTASLVFCLQRSRIEVNGFKTTVTGQIERRDRGRLRIGELQARISLPLRGEAADKAERCLALFEDFCVVTASVRQGIPVSVEVVDQDGTTRFMSPAEEDDA